jgi:DNA-binding PadR family transcriptional regulator
MSLNYAVLGLLQYRDMHGYRIKEHLENNFGHMWSVNFGQIYPILKDLEKKGFIRMLKEASVNNQGPQRKLYSITDKGREVFSQWLREPAERSMLLRDPFLLKFAFFGFGGPQDALRIIDGQIASYEAQLERRSGNSLRWETQGPYVKMLSDLGIEFNAMYLEWLRSARKQIEDNIADKGYFTTASNG